MESINPVYLDNRVVRELIEKPEIRIELFDDFCRHIGRRYQPIPSYYLFFEYIGFHKTKLEIPKDLQAPTLPFLQKLKKENLSKDELATIDQELIKAHSSIKEHVNAKFYTLITHFKHLIKVREVRLKIIKRKFKKEQDGMELHEILFAGIINLFRKSLPEFVERASEYLAWDIFCTLNPPGVSTPRLRQRQLAHWFKMHQDGITLPFGKLIDDHAGYYNMKFDSNYKSYEDMVDSEALTYLVTGLKDADHQILAIKYVTFDASNEIGERIQLGLGTLQNIEQTLSVCIPKQTGKAYLLDTITHKIVNIHESTERKNIICL